jgi:hypothetical protein
MAKIMMIAVIQMIVFIEELFFAKLRIPYLPPKHKITKSHESTFTKLYY